MNCAPAKGRVYFLIVELDGVGTYQTINYYPKGEISSSPGIYRLSFDAAAMTSREIFVVSADAQAAKQLENPPVNGIINNLPTGAEPASLSVTSTRTS